MVHRKNRVQGHLNHITRYISEELRKIVLSSRSTEMQWTKLTWLMIQIKYRYVMYIHGPVLSMLTITTRGNQEIQENEQNNINILRIRSSILDLYSVVLLEIFKKNDMRTRKKAQVHSIKIKTSNYILMIL